MLYRIIAAAVVNKSAKAKFSIVNQAPLRKVLKGSIMIAIISSALDSTPTVETITLKSEMSS